MLSNIITKKEKSNSLSAEMDLIHIVIVEDKGIGISKNELERIFESFTELIRAIQSRREDQG